MRSGALPRQLDRIPGRACRVRVSRTLRQASGEVSWVSQVSLGFGNATAIETKDSHGARFKFKEAVFEMMLLLATS